MILSLSTFFLEDTCVHFNWARLLIGKQWILIFYHGAGIDVEHIVVHVLIFFFLKGRRDQCFIKQYC